MNNVLLNLYPLLLLVITFFGVKKAKKGEVAEEFLSPGQTKMLQGSVCIAIIMHHVVQDITSYGVYRKGPITQFNDMGILMTSVFFFISGYGLITSVNTRPGYLKTFLRKRLPTVLIPFFITNIIGILIFKYYCNIHMSASLIKKYLIGTYLINGNAWFIIEIVILYLSFYILFRLIKNRDIALVLMCVVTLVIIWYASKQGHDMDGFSRWFRGEWWYNSTIVFAFGMVFARFKDKLTAFFNKRYTVKLIVVAVLFVGTYIAAVYANNCLGYYQLNMSFHARREQLITLAAQSIACLFSTLLIILLNMKLTLNNKALKYLGGISLEVYLLHRYFLDKIFGSMRLSDTQLLGLVIVSSLAAAAIVSPIIKWIVKGVTSLLCKKKPQLSDGDESVAPKLKTKRHLNEYELALKAKKRKKITLTVIVVIAAAAAIFTVAYFTFLKNLIAKRTYNKEIKALKEASVGDEVYFGRFDTSNSTLGRDRLSWIVVKKEGNTVCLVTSCGIAGSSYNTKHENVSWENSNLRKELNSDKFTSMFSSYEAESIVPVDGDIISLLTVSEAAEYFSTDADRELSITEVAEAKGTNINVNSKANQWDMKGYRSSWWWLRGEPGVEDIYAPVVSVDGTIQLKEKEVNRPYGAIRPYIQVLITD